MASYPLFSAAVLMNKGYLALEPATHCSAADFHKNGPEYRPVPVLVAYSYVCMRAANTATAEGKNSGASVSQEGREGGRESH